MMPCLRTAESVTQQNCSDATIMGTDGETADIHSWLIMVTHRDLFRHALLVSLEYSRASGNPVDQKQVTKS